MHDYCDIPLCDPIELASFGPALVGLIRDKLADGPAPDRIEGGSPWRRLGAVLAAALGRARRVP